MIIFNRLYRYLKPYSARLAVALVSMAGVSGLTALSLYLIKPALDKVFIAGDMHMLYRLVIILPLLFIVKGLFSYAQNYLMAYIGLYAIADLRQALFDHVQLLSMDYFSAKSTGKIVARLTNDLLALQNVIARSPVYLVRDGLTAVCLIGVLFKLSWKFTLTTLCVLPLSALVIWALGKSLRRIGKKGQNQMGELYSAIQENVQAASVVRAYTAEKEESARFSKHNVHARDLALRFAKTDTLSSPAMETVGALIAAFLLLKGGSDVIRGVWTTGSFFAFMGAALSTYRPLKNFAELNSQIQLGAASAERIFELLDEDPKVRELPTSTPLPAFSQSIEYRAISFQYPAHESAQDAGVDVASPVVQKRYALQDVNIRINSGEIIALVGSSGAGKTTLALLLPRFYDPSSGQVLIDGRDARQATLNSLRGQIGLVTQEVLLFNESIRYNIAYGKRGASDSEIESAARAANAHRFIDQLPDKYDTIIGERGMRLSGGERQRLSIARAILKNPPILILDEATSALDAESERLVQEALERLMTNRTAIVIAHRLSTVRKADRIIVLEHGRIVEEGHHQALLEQRGTYHKLHSLQLLQ